MLPETPVPTEKGLMNAYLVEARSIGEISGSPVFSRRTMSLLWNDGVSLPTSAIHGLTGEVHLTGMMHGHWDIKESEINQPRLVHDSKRGVNMGIAIVVPIDDIINTLNHPELLAQRAMEETQYLAMLKAKAD